MHYGPVSYYSLGRVYPRRRLREPYFRMPPPRLPQYISHPAIVSIGTVLWVEPNRPLSWVEVLRGLTWVEPSRPLHWTDPSPGE